MEIIASKRFQFLSRIYISCSNPMIVVCLPTLGNDSFLKDIRNLAFNFMGLGYVGVRLCLVGHY